MKILVVGATGFIGKKVTSQLRGLGHEVVSGSPSLGVNIITGEGLSDALKDTDVVIDLSGPKSLDGSAVISFFREAGKILLSAEKKANIKHHIVLSIVGTDKVPHIKNLSAKKEQEDIVKHSGIPYTIVRSTQFYELVDKIIAVQSKNDEVYVSAMEFQPIAADDVSTLIAQIALEQPINGTVEIAGPERAPMNEIIARYLSIRNDVSRSVVPNGDNQYMWYEFPKSALVPEGDFRAGQILFDDWARS